MQVNHNLVDLNSKLRLGITVEPSTFLAPALHCAFRNVHMCRWCLLGIRMALLLIRGISFDRMVYRREPLSSDGYER